MNTQAIDVLVQKVQALPDPNARNTALELVQAVMDLHASGLERMMEILSECPAEGAPIDALASDALVSSILLLHDLHPVDLDTRVRQALDRPEFRSRGASVELTSIHDGVVRVRIQGGNGLSAAVESVLLEAAPDAAEIIVEGGHTNASGFVPLTALVAG